MSVWWIFCELEIDEIKNMSDVQLWNAIYGNARLLSGGLSFTNENICRKNLFFLGEEDCLRHSDKSFTMEINSMENSFG